MFIKYNGYDLLELFCQEPKIINDEADIFSYKTEDSFGLSLYMYVSTYDKNVLLQLEHKNYKKPIISLDLYEVERLHKEEERLKIIRAHSQKLVTVYFKPDLRLEVET